jgi:serine phosphatase RsbU (regulator of sigma subunit)
MVETKVIRENWFYRLAKFVRRDILPVDKMEHAEQAVDAVGFLYSGLLALVGLVWLALATNWSLFVTHWWVFLVAAAIWYLLSRLKFYMIADLTLRGGPGYANAEGNFETIARWSAVLILGPGALWIGIVLVLAEFLPRIFKAGLLDQRWSVLRNLTFSLDAESFLPLITLSLYRIAGGMLPLQELSWQTLLRFVGLLMVQMLLEVIFLWCGYLIYILWMFRDILDRQARRGLVSVLMVGIVVPYIPAPFAALAAWLYAQGGLGFYLFFMLGLALVAYVARQLSRASESSRQQAQQLDRLEQLGRALLNAPPDASKLSDILNQHIPGMFLSREAAIWLAPDRYLLKRPSELDEAKLFPVWQWLMQHKEAFTFSSKDSLPWEKANEKHLQLAITPVLDAESSQTLGGIYVTLQGPVVWDRKALQGLLPTLQTLAAQISTALHQARVYQETLAYQKTMQELAFARRVQSSFLPEMAPELPGWTLAATLEPARQTSGDFYDFIPLPEGRLGILIADVADKGLGPALYMALSRTLIRTFAMQLEAPDEVLRAANQRILEDSRSDLFVTVFYGVVDARNNCLNYCNAGHPPAILVNRLDGNLRELKSTGMALGVDESAPLKQASVDLKPGDVLFLYTDGVTDAQNPQGEFIDTQAVMSVAQNQPGASALDIQKNVLERIRQFVENAPQFDDITMIVLASEVTEKVRL